MKNKNSRQQSQTVKSAKPVLQNADKQNKYTAPSLDVRPRVRSVKVVLLGTSAGRFPMEEQQETLHE